MAVKERYIGEIYADGKKVGDILSFCLKVKKSDGVVEYKVSPKKEEKEEKQDD